MATETQTGLSKHLRGVTVTTLACLAGIAAAVASGVVVGTDPAAASDRLTVGILAGFIWLRTGSVFLGYAISAISLLFLNLGVEKIPVTHHITLIGAVGAMVVAGSFGDLSTATFPVGAVETTGSVAALLAAGGFGAISGLLGEVTQRIFYAHSGTHVDPPAMAIALAMVIVAVLAITGVLPNAGYL